MDPPLSERSKEIIIKTSTAKENLTPQKNSVICECCAVRNRLPAYVPNSARLNQAQKLGVLDAKNIIGIFEKKKEEAGIGTSTSYAEKTDSQNKLCSILDYEEELKEEMLFVEDLNYIENYGIEDFCKCSELNKKCRDIQASETVSITETNMNKQNISSDARKDVSIQYIPNCRTKILKLSTTKEGSEIDTDLYYSNLKLSAVSIQCNIDKSSNIDQYIREPRHVTLKPRSDHLQEREERLKFLLKKSLGHQREQKHDHAWDKYINELRKKHRSYDPNIESYDSPNYNNRYPISRTTSHRKLQSTFLADEYYGVHRLPRSGESNRIRSTEIESLGGESPSPIDSPISCFSKIPSYSKFRISYPTSGSDFESQRRTALCYPSILSSQYQSHESNGIRNKHLCRNIFSIPKPTGRKTKSCFDNPCDDFYSFSEETKRQNAKGVFRHSFSNNVSNERQTEQDDFLVPVEEESNHSTKTCDNNKKRMPFTKMHEEESMNQNHNTAIPINNNNSGSGTINSIENKLDKLIDSIHALITEVKSKGMIEKKNDSKNYVVPLFNNLDNKLRYIKKYNKINKTKSDPLRISTGDQILESVSKFLANSEIDVKGIISPKNDKSCEIKLIVSSKTRTKSTNTIAIEPSPYYGFPRTKTIKPKLVEKSRHHHVVCDQAPHALEITVDFLMKEPPKIIEKVIETNQSVNTNENKMKKSPVTKSMLADTSINTEPLSFGEISRETVKRIVSFFPLVEYYWSRLPIPTIGYSKRTLLECEICKKTFTNVAELNKHRTMHNFLNNGKPTSCFLCHESLNNTSKRTIKAVVPLPKLFSCRYCGETFTRAYSLQLHEHNCEKKHPKDESNSLVVLS